MSVGRARLALWLGLALMAPLPLFTGVVSGLVPVARMLMLAGVCLLVALAEGTRGGVGLLLLLLAAQAALYLGLLWGVAHGLARLLGRLPPRGVAAAVGGLLLAGALLTASAELYRTPFRADAARSSLLGIFR